MGRGSGKGVLQSEFLHFLPELPLFDARVPIHAVIKHGQYGVHVPALEREEDLRLGSVPRALEYEPALGDVLAVRLGLLLLLTLAPCLIVPDGLAEFPGEDALYLVVVLHVLLRVLVLVRHGVSAEDELAFGEQVSDLRVEALVLPPVANREVVGRELGLAHRGAVLRELYLRGGHAPAGLAEVVGIVLRVGLGSEGGDYNGRNQSECDRFHRGGFSSVELYMENGGKRGAWRVHRNVSPVQSFDRLRTNGFGFVVGLSGGVGRNRRNTQCVCFMKRQRKEKGCFFILLFLDEKKQKSSDYR